MIFALTSTFTIVPLLFELHFLRSHLHLHSHDIYFIILDAFIPVIMFNMLRFKSSVFFVTHTLLDKSLRILQLPTST